MDKVSGAFRSGINKGAQQKVSPGAITMQKRLKKQQDSIGKIKDLEGKVQKNDLMDLPELSDILEEKDFGDLAGSPTTSRPSTTSGT